MKNTLLLFTLLFTLFLSNFTLASSTNSTNSTNNPWEPITVVVDTNFNPEFLSTALGSCISDLYYPRTMFICGGVRVYFLSFDKLQNKVLIGLQNGSIFIEYKTGLYFQKLLIANTNNSY